MSIKLPKEKVKVENKNPRTFILYSQPKMGKTTLLSQLDDCLIIDLENGSDLVEALKVKVNNLKEFFEVGEQIKADGCQYKYVAIDTISKLEEWAEESAKKLYQQTPMGKRFTGDSVLTLPNGAGYLYLRLAFKKWLEYINGLAEHVILIGHLKDKLIERKGKEVSAKDLALTGQIRNITAASADAMGFLYREDGELKVNFQASSELVVGSRCEHLAGQDFAFDWSKIYID
jgi:hypothetical protein